jgi:hypothetical protein
MTPLAANARTLEKEYAWLSEVIQLRLANYFQSSDKEGGIYDIPPPEPEAEAPYAAFLEKMNERVAAEFDETGASLQQVQLAHRLLLLLALASHVKPAVLDIFFTRNTLYDRPFTEFGGVSGRQHAGFLPTGETAMFLLAGDDLALRIRLLALFEESYFLYTDNIIRLQEQQAHEPLLSGALNISDEYKTLITTGKTSRRRSTNDFPASQLQTKLNWGDLVLEPHLLDDLSDISTWLKHEATIMEGMGLNKLLKPGYRALFYGPPGTGKTLSATLLGQGAGRPVYRINLSQIVSKYIGETEKNLAQLFARAERNNWMLFFDEADALFGKRTGVKDSHDRYANQEVSYLLQRIEEHSGLVILSTNLKGNIDEAFSRRFQSMLYFPIPGSEQRLRLWQNAFSEGLCLADEVDLQQIARDYELTGGSIINVVRYCALSAAGRGKQVVGQRDVLEGVRRELRRVK